MTVHVDSGDLGMSASPRFNGDGDQEPQAKDRHGLYCAGEVNLLVIDDDEGICRVIQAALSDQGYPIDTVSDPGEIEKRLRSKPYQVIILDYVIPPLQSEQVLDWVKEFQPEASIIVVTGFPSIDSALHCLRARTYDYITKPFQVTQLQRVVTRCLESKGLLRMSEKALRESLGVAI